MAIAGLRQVVGRQLEVGREPAAKRLQGGPGVHLQQPDDGQRPATRRTDSTRSIGEQMERIAREFPGKSMSYSLIQDGFPRVNNDGCYLNETNTKICPPASTVPWSAHSLRPQTIIDYARSTYGDDVAIAHLGLGPKPDFSDPVQYAAGTGCPLPLAPDGFTSAYGPNGVGSGCPNKWATDVGAVGGLTHFQTNHVPQTPALLASALDNMWSNSNSAMLEIYEAQAWVSRRRHPRSDAPPRPAAHARAVE